MIGQGRLVMAERFNQFSGLVDNCEFKQGEKETTCMDLKGFWEMIYFQVYDCLDSSLVYSSYRLRMLIRSLPSWKESRTTTGLIKKMTSQKGNLLAKLGRIL